MTPTDWAQIPGPSDEALAARIKMALDQKRLSQSKLSEYLGCGNRSAVTRMFHKPSLFRPHVVKIASFLGASPTALLGTAHEDPAPPAPTGDGAAGATVVSESLLSRAIPGAEIRDGALVMVPGMMIRHLARSECNHLRTARASILCSATNALPAKGDVVIAETRDGAVWLRKYDRDFRDRSKLILGAFNPGDDPLVIEEADLAELRIVIGTVNLGVLP